MLRVASRKFESLRAIVRRLCHDEAGSVLTFLVAVPVVIGAAALGIQTGELYRVKRQMQSAADAAAISGSIDRINSSSTLTTDAQYAAQRNGFTNGSSGVSVTVNSPPTSGSYTTSSTAVEVIITKPQALSLGAVLTSWLGGSGNTSVTMRARSVAAQRSFTQGSTTGPGCIVALTTGAEQGVSFSSFNTFTSDCAVMSNGSATGTDSSSASVSISSFNKATVSQVWTRGSYYTDNASHITPIPSNALTNQTSTIADPTVGFSNPSVGSCTYSNYNKSSMSSLTVSPGTYCGGLSVSSVSNVYFTPGIYYVADGDMYLDSVSNVTCPTCTTSNGVAIILTTATGTPANIGGVYIASDNNVSLNAGSSGTYAGILFYQDHRASVGTMTSTSKIFTVSSLNTATLTGAIYFPNNRIEIASINNFDNGNAACTVWVGRYIKFSSLNNTNSGSCPTYGTNPVSAISTTTVSKATTVE